MRLRKQVALVTVTLAGTANAEAAGGMQYSILQPALNRIQRSTQNRDTKDNLLGMLTAVSQRCHPCRNRFGTFSDGHLIGPVRAAELLDGLVGAPGQLKRQVHASPLIERAAVGMQTDARRCCLADDRDQLFARQEQLTLQQVRHIGCDMTLLSKWVGQRQSRHDMLLLMESTEPDVCLLAKLHM